MKKLELKQVIREMIKEVKSELNEVKKLSKGDRVKVVSGKFKGYDGVIISKNMYKGQYLVQTADEKIKGFKSNELESLKENIEQIHEAKPVKGKKSFYQMDNVGKAKYTINKYDGKSTHKDGSPFYDIAIFSNKKDLEKYKKDLFKQEYTEE